MDNKELLKKAKSNYDEAYAEYVIPFKRAKILDATDRGKLWKAIQAEFPKYQVLPDTNHVAYVKGQLLASLYSVGRVAEVLPTSEEDSDLVKHINIGLEYIWRTQNVAHIQMQAGERAALLNLGITQVGWDNSIISGKDETFTKGQVTFKNIDPMRFMRDPYAIDLDAAAYCMTWDNFHKNTILNNSLYKDEFKKYLESNKTGTGTTSSTAEHKYTDTSGQAKKDRYTIFTHWIRTEEGITELHTVNNAHVLHVKENIEPAIFPFSELECNLRTDDVLGTSEPSKIFANSVAYNLLNSIGLTAEVKNQKPPRYVNVNAGINLREFIKHGSDSDYVFPVRGDASKAVHYHQFPPPSPVAQSIANGLGLDINLVSGVNSKYTGADTGSILTTGGIEQMLDQATMIDQPKINNYEAYTKRLTELVLGNLRKHGKKRRYFVKTADSNNKYHTIEVEYDALDDDTIYSYEIVISPMLPKNKYRIAQTANMIMEKQMQYNAQGMQVELITPEEWLSMQDLPNQQQMLERMGIQRTQNYTEQVAKTVFQYASLLEAGYEPEEALMETANAIEMDQPSPLGLDQMGEQTEPPGAYPE